MVKILGIGDFHGKFPEKIRGLIKREKIDLVVSVGDFFPFSYRKLWFEHCYNKDIELWEVIGKKKHKALIMRDLDAGEKVLKKLNGLGVPVITTIGNLDYTGINDSADYRVKWKWLKQDFFYRILKKYNNIFRFDFKSYEFKGLVFIGGFGHTFPGKVRSKSYKKYKGILDNLFVKYKKENKSGKLIFVFHNMPYDCRLDKLGPNAHEAVRGKHYGSKMIRRLIDKYQPVLGIGGHIHENPGKEKIGNSLIINTGALVNGEMSIIDLDEEKGKVRSVRFIRKL